MLTFAAIGAIAFSSVFSAWGILEFEKGACSGQENDEHQPGELAQPFLSPNQIEENKEGKRVEYTLLTNNTGFPNDSFKKVQPSEENSPPVELCKTQSSEISEFLVSNSTDKESIEDKMPAITNLDTTDERKASEVKEKENQAKMAELIDLLESEINKRKEEQERKRREQLTQLVEAERKRRMELEIAEKEKLEKQQREIEARQIIGRGVFALAIDQSLRSKRKFSANDPLSFEWNLSNIASEFEQKKANFNSRYFDCIKESTTDFIRSHRRFSVKTVKNQNIVQLNFLTPYQGNNKVVGHYCCPKCTRTWKNTSSIRDSAYPCKNCEIEVYPFKQDFDELEFLEVV